MTLQQDGEDSASTHAAGLQEMVDRVGKVCILASSRGTRGP